MLLDGIKSPNDIKSLEKSELIRLSVEIRDFLLNSISKTGGHLASNLGVVELTIALHKVYSTPKDKIVWDVGHQAYVHKLLTGRKKDFDKLRQLGGLSGFPKRCESAHDCFETGHSSTSISAAVGLAKARNLKGAKNHVVAVIGDGALTGGMAFEALNHAGHEGLDFTVILNDNEMSISKNTGAMSKYLRSLRLAPTYTHIKGETRTVLSSIPRIGKPLTNSIQTVKTGLKVMLANGMLFEGLGYKHYGPIDGHNIDELVRVLELAKNVEGPKLIHVVTKKGKGYVPAEMNPSKFHGISAFDIKTGQPLKQKSKLTYSKIFGNTLTTLAENDSRIVAITAAMPDGTGLIPFKEKMPNRYIDVGIAEQHAVTMAAGLASEGLKPVFAVYSTFLQRAYDQILHDVCIQNLPVVFAIDRAGLVGNDGETHHGVFDMSYLTHIPNMTVLAPKSGRELENMLSYALKEHEGPIAIRYPRGEAAEFEADLNIEKNAIEPEILIEGKDIVIVACGKMVQCALDASKIMREHGIHCGVINIRQVYPLKSKALHEKIITLGANHIVTLEDNALEGGFGGIIQKWISDEALKIDVQSMGIPNCFVEHGNVDELMQKIGLDPVSIARRIEMKVRIRSRLNEKRKA